MARVRSTGRIGVVSSPTARSIARLRADMRGRVIEPEDAAYDEARTVFVGGIDRRPAVIVQPADSDEVSRVVTFARESELPLAIRSGGHSAVGHSVCDDGVVLDLRAMKQLDIDFDGGTAWAA